MVFRFLRFKKSPLCILLSICFISGSFSILLQSLLSSGPESDGIDFELEEIIYSSSPNPNISSPSYHQFHVDPSRIHLKPLLSPVTILRQPCLSEWLTSGTLTDISCLGSPAPPVDFIWTWINGSDLLWAQKKAIWSTFEKIGRTQRVPGRHYRDHGELKHSMRSVENSMDYKVEEDRGRYKLILGDWEGEEEGHMRIGQKPGWLKFDAEGGKNQVDLIWHAEIWNTFDKKKGDGSANKDRNQQIALLKQDLPTFNSFSIESQFFNLPNTSPTFVYLNDDFFLTAPHTSTDFHSPTLFGPIVPFVFSQQGYIWPAPIPPPKTGIKKFLVEQPTPLPTPFQGGFIGYNPMQAVSCNHEFSSLGRSNYLISKRFGFRPRATLLHIPKPLLQPILQESALIWASEFKGSTKRRFREDGRILPGDFNPVWLGETLLVERGREAMLWTWAVVKMGQGSRYPGHWEREEYELLRKVLKVDEFEMRMRKYQASQPLSVWAKVFGLSTIKATEVVVIPEHDKRQTLDPIRMRHVLESVGQPIPKQNTYGWTSLDGPLPPFGATIRNCTVHFNHCFGSWWRRMERNRKGHNDGKYRAEEIFTRIAYEFPECGDCLLSALIQNSGPLGMSQIIPERRKVSVQRTRGRMERTGEQPFLSLERDWKTVDYSLQGVLGSGRWGTDIEIKDWCEQLIARYTWTAISNSTALFRMINSENALKSAIEMIEADPPPPTAALNDDMTAWREVKEDVIKAEKMGRLFEEWLDGYWPVAGDWEV